MINTLVEIRIYTLEVGLILINIQRQKKRNTLFYNLCSHCIKNETCRHYQHYNALFISVTLIIFVAKNMFHPSKSLKLN